MTDRYSRRWFATFLDTKPTGATAAEVAGLVAHLPLPSFRSVLDVGCGPGRHAAALVDLGYDVTGVDRDPVCVATAREHVPAARFVAADMRELDAVGGTFDAVVSLWQSFGYFDSATNDAVLAAMARRLRPGGRLAIDLYHPDWHRAQVGVRSFDAHPGTSVEVRVEGARVQQTIRYADGAQDELEWELIGPDDLAARAARAGLREIARCSFWDPTRRVGADVPRYQCVFERSADQRWTE